MILLASAVAWAETMGIPSLEWSATSCEFVVVARSVTPEEGGVRIVVDRVITAEIPYRQDLLALGDWGYVDAVPSELVAVVDGGVRVGSAGLLGLRFVDEPGEVGPPGRWVVAHVFGDTGVPGLRGAEVRADGRVVRGAAIEAALRERRRDPGSPFLSPGRRLHGVTVELGHGPAYDLAFAGSAVYLVVPPDPALADALITLASSPRWPDQERAARGLTDLPAVGRDALVRLLGGPGVEVIGADGAVVGRVWPVREAAYDALAARGQLPDDDVPTVERIDTPLSAAPWPD